MSENQKGPVGDRTPLEFVLGQNNSRNSEIAVSKQEPRAALPDLWINIGQECIGRLYKSTAGFGAFSDAGKWLGSFTTLQAARAAIWEEHCRLTLPERAAA